MKYFNVKARITKCKSVSETRKKQGRVYVEELIQKFKSQHNVKVREKYSKVKGKSRSKKWCRNKKKEAKSGKVEGLVAEH